MTNKFKLVVNNECEYPNNGKVKDFRAVSKYVKEKAMVKPHRGVGRERLVMKNLKMVYPHCRGRLVVLEDLSLTVYGGEAIVVLAPPKSGKSTLGYVLSGMQRQTGGKMYLCRWEWPHPTLWDRPRQTWPVQLVRQAPYRALIGGISLKEILRKEYKDLEKVEVDRPLFSPELCVSLVGLKPEQLNEELWSFSRLSYVQATIALRLVGNPKILILDDIFEGLTDNEIFLLHTYLYRLRLETGISIVFIAGQVEAALGPLNRVAILKEGRLVTFDCKKDREIWMQLYKDQCADADLRQSMRRFAGDDGRMGEIRLKKAA